MTLARCFATAVALLTASIAISDGALAQDPFFKNKTVTIAVGSTPGGGLDLFGRLVSRHLGKHLPGNPSVIVQNMPGAGGGIAATHLYAIAPKDGTSMAVVFPSVLIDPLLNDALRKDYDPTKFNYLGNANPETLTCMFRTDVPIASLADLRKTEVVIGATAPGSTTYDFPTVANAVLGFKMKIVAGYKGSRDVTLAIEKGEVQGICGLGWSTVKAQYPDILDGKRFGRVVAQEDLTGHPELNAKGVPLMISLAQTDDERTLLQTFYAQNAFSRPFLLPPGVPAERIAQLRAAFLDTLKDAELLAEAAKSNTDVAPTSGEDVQALVAKMYATPAPLVQRLKTALGRDK
jgi:tripartite-type tricarboxylate transporter receptor subunit TctC